MFQAGQWAALIDKLRSMSEFSSYPEHWLKYFRPSPHTDEAVLGCGCGEELVVSGLNMMRSGQMEAIIQAMVHHVRERSQ